MNKAMVPIDAHHALLSSFMIITPLITSAKERQTPLYRFLVMSYKIKDSN